jgi:hypothetical protein
MFISTTKGGMSLIEYYTASIYFITNAASGSLSVISKKIVIMIEQGYIDTGIARIHHNVDRFVKA